MPSDPSHPAGAEAPDVVQDAGRLAALRRLKALDTAADAGLDSLTGLVREFLDVPVALVTLVDADRQFFKSCLGLDEPWSSTRETPLSHSFCRFTIGRDDYLAIEDARKHPLAAESPGIAELDIGAYLGIPLVTHDGHAVGSLCAIDHEPRPWADRDVVLLQTLAENVIRRLELRARKAELEEARNTLEKREIYYRSLIERGMDAVTVLDAEGRILYTSPNSREILGRTPEERAGRSAFDWVHPDDFAEIRSEFEKILEDPGGTARVEFRYEHPERGWLRLEGIGRNLLDEPVVEGIVFNFRDVTRERQLEEDLRQRRKLETIGELTAGISHDFNNLLAVVTANAELLSDSLRPEADEARQDLEDLQAAAAAGTELIRSLMTFSRKSEPRLRPTDLGAVVTQAGRMLRRILPSPIRVDWSVPTELTPAHADPRAVEQILLNLATNARDAMPQGGSLTIGVVAEDEPSSFVRLEVTDTGTGMDEETLEQAFRPFFTTKGIGEGTGLGLAMIARLVEQHEGEIDMESEVGKGTRVTIRLRKASGPVAEASRVASRTYTTTGNELVLLVEDEEALRRTGARVLERAGFRVTVAADGRAGLEAFRARKDEISLIVSDQDMPALTGTALLREIRAAGSSVPFVLTTGYTARDLTDGDELPEGMSFVTKPWSLEELIGVVRAALEGA